MDQYTNYETIVDWGNTNPGGDSHYVLSVFDGTEAPYFIDLQSFQKTVITFGRSPDNDIILKSNVVGRHHGSFRLDLGGCTVTDNNSKNGTYVNGTRVYSQQLQDGDQIRIASGQEASHGGVLLLVENRNDNVSWQSISLTGKNEFLIGRDSSCDIKLDHQSVSRIHAIIAFSGGRYILTDNNSLNGVFINGIRVHRRQVLRDKDVIVITNNRLLYAHGVLNYCSYSNGIGVEAVDIVKMVKSGRKKKVISNHISLSIDPGSFVGIVGGSGSGKTTFMNCLSGYNPATQGHVLINGVDLYDNYSVFKSIIGYVPQQDIVHGDLPLRKMLDYAARLRMPMETTKAEREARVQSVIKTVELQGHEETMINLLSGGQRKRASIAVELLSDPKLFFLDEPSSGLDPGTEKNLMQTMHNMSRQGITIVLITHTIQNISLFDKIIFLGKGGNLCYYGTPKGAESFFGVSSLADAYNMAETDSKAIADRFKRSFATGSGGSSGSSEKPSSHKESFGRIIRKVLGQTWTLSLRYTNTMINDRQRMLLLLLQPPLLAFLISLAKDGHQYEHRMITMAILFAISCSAFWIGILNAIQEICKEKVILKRENMAGLSQFAYVTSKFLVLAVLSLLQCGLLLLFFKVMVGLPEEGIKFPPLVEMYITIYLTAISAATLGLLVSSFFDNPDRALVVAPILIMPQILFSGILFDLEGTKNTISYFTTCRWSMQAFGITAKFNDLPQVVDISGLEQKMFTVRDIFEQTLENMNQAWIMLGIMTLVCYLLSYISLRIKKL